MDINLENIDNIIFDFGGVIIDIDYNRTVQAFSELGLKESDLMHADFYHESFIADFEKGNLPDEAFINELKKILPSKVTSKQIIDAWNAMIGKLPLERLNVLKNLKTKYRTFLLSNTNNIHIDFFKNKIRNDNNTDLDIYFEKSYYSSEIGMRKPDAEIYNHVISENNLEPQRTIFIDDLLINIESAKNIGLKTFHMPKNKSISDYFIKLLKNGN